MSAALSAPFEPRFEARFRPPRRDELRSSLLLGGTAWLLLLAGAGVAAQPTAPIGLSVDVSVTPEGVATFTWSLTDDDVPVVCVLDPDGDGDFDYSIGDCHDESEQSHSYEEPGVYTATMMARSRDGRAEQVSLRVPVPE